MDELATTVSDILNQAAGGVGDLSQWLASNGLPGYARVSTAQCATVCVLSLIVLVPLAVTSFLWYKKCRSLYDSGRDGFFYAFASGILAFFGLCLFIAFYTNVIDLVGWIASPDGMLLQTLVKSIKS